MKIRRHLSYANVAATVALVGVLGGGAAYAGGLIGSGDVQNNSLRSKDLRNHKAVAARDVKRDALTGKQIRERTLNAAQFSAMGGSQEVGASAGHKYAIKRQELRDRKGEVQRLLTERDEPADIAPLVALVPWLNEFVTAGRQLSISPWLG